MSKWLKISMREFLVLIAMSAILIAWWLDHQQMQARIDEILSPSVIPNWQTTQLIGEPDTIGSGDFPTAWASETRDGQKEWIALQYRKVLQPKWIHIHETYNPGAVYKVSAFNWLGQEIVLWKGVDPISPAAKSGIARIPVSRHVKTRNIRVYIDSPRVPGWNEIDAVAVVDSNGEKHWAIQADASSCYSDMFENNFQISNGLGFRSRVIVTQESDTKNP